MKRLIGMVLVLVVGCGTETESPKTSAAHDGKHKKLTIALIPGLTTDSFYITMRKGAELAAKGLGVELSLIHI